MFNLFKRKRKKDEVVLKFKFRLSRKAKNKTTIAKLQNELMDAINYTLDEYGEHVMNDNLMMLRTEKIKDTFYRNIQLDFEEDDWEL